MPFKNFRISNNREVSDKFQKHVLVIMAFAFVTSYCFRQKICFELIFYSNKLRSRLLECFENNRIAEFPLASKTISTGTAVEQIRRVFEDKNKDNFRQFSIKTYVVGIH